MDVGDSIWAFTKRNDGTYVMAAELVVRAKTINPASYRYGAYRVWGDLRATRYLRADVQPSVEHLIRGLSPTTNARLLGQAFQGRAAVRRLTAEDHQVLAVMCRGLPLEPRARLVPEERLEAAMLTGDPNAVAGLLHDEDPGLAQERHQYLYTRAATRSRRLVGELKELYDGACQLCEWQPRTSYDVDLCEAHHIQWLCRGGEGDLANLLLLCPNHHRAVHGCDAHLDFDDLAVDFGTRREPLALDSHLANLRRPTRHAEAPAGLGRRRS